MMKRNMMNNNNEEVFTRRKKTWAKACVIASCVAVLYSGPSFAAANISEPMASIQIEPIVAEAPSESVQAEGEGTGQFGSSAAVSSSSEMLEQQRLIDQFLFEEHAQELKEKGIRVTLTSPNSDHVEIGLDPFKEEYAEYLYEQLADYEIKVVEVEQAYTLGPAVIDSGNEVLSDPDRPVSSPALPVVTDGGATQEEPILQLQAEIDRFLFEEHAEQLEEQGITVTHTSPGKERVEIGIASYNEEDAAYLYEQLGQEQIVVVEGEQAVTFGTTGSAEMDLNQTNRTTEGAMEMTTTAASEQPAEESNKSLYALALGAIAVLGSGLLLFRNRLFGRTR